MSYQGLNLRSEVDRRVTAATDFLNTPSLYHLSQLNADRWVSEAVAFMLGLREKVDATYHNPTKREEVMNYAYQKFEELEEASQRFISG